MALVTVREILTPRPQGWAVGAFNVHNMEDVVWAAEELKAPVIIQVLKFLKYAERLPKGYCQSGSRRVLYPLPCS